MGLFGVTLWGVTDGIVYAVGWVFTVVIALLLVMLAWEWLKTVPGKVRLRLSEWRDESVAHLHDRLDASVKDEVSVRRRLKAMRQEVAEVADKLKRAGETCDEDDFARFDFGGWEKSLRIAISKVESDKDGDVKSEDRPSPEMSNLVGSVAAVVRDMRVVDDHFPGGVVDLVVGRDRLSTLR